MRVGLSWTDLLALTGHTEIPKVICGLGGRSLDFGWAILHVWMWDGSKLVYDGFYQKD
jgi:hypothetical protein